MRKRNTQTSADVIVFRHSSFPVVSCPFKVSHGYRKAAPLRQDLKLGREELWLGTGSKWIGPRLVNARIGDLRPRWDKIVDVCTRLKIRLHLPKASLTANAFPLATTYLQFLLHLSNAFSYTVIKTTQAHFV